MISWESKSTTFVRQMQSFMRVKLLRSTTLIFLLCITSYSYASHIVSGDMSYTYLGGNSYEFNLTIYRDCSADGVDFDSFVYFSVRYTDSGEHYGDFIDSLDEETIQNVPFYELYSIPCVTYDSDTCYEFAVYSKIINLPPTIGGYTIAYQRCCLPVVTNIESAEYDGITTACQVPGAMTYENTSPQFPIHSPFVVCNNTLTSFDHSAFDADGDSLSYTMTDPLKGATSFYPNPATASPPPYLPFVWTADHNALEPLGETGTITIDETSGMLNIYPTVLGNYLFAIKVQEYREGELISEKVRTILLNVIEVPDVGNTAEFKNASDEDLSIYPNPVRNSFSINTNSKIDTILIYDNSGNLMKKSIQNTEIDIGELASGFYYIVVMTENQYLIKKLEKY